MKLKNINEEVLMFILDYSYSKMQAFINGFMKSITSPATLFRDRKIQSLQPIALLRYPNVKEANALKEDWLKIGLWSWKSHSINSLTHLNDCVQCSFRL
jgi:hypothetical protein